MNYKEKRINNNDLKKIKEIIKSEGLGNLNFFCLYDGERKFGYTVGNRSMYFEKISKNILNLVDDFHNTKKEYIYE